MIEMTSEEISRKKERRIRERLLNDLRNLAKMLGKTPTCLDMDVEPSMEYSKVYIKTFGSWNKAVEAAGLQPNWKVKKRKR